MTSIIDEAALWTKFEFFAAERGIDLDDMDAWEDFKADNGFED